MTGPPSETAPAAPPLPAPPLPGVPAAPPVVVATVLAAVPLAPPCPVAVLDAPVVLPVPAEWTFDPAEPAPSVVVRLSGSVPMAPHATTFAAMKKSVHERATVVGFFSCRARDNGETTAIMHRYLEEDAIRQGRA
jgi:hypothetical protein